MTEWHEITSLIESLGESLDEIEYEAASRPNEGPIFTSILLTTATHIKKAIHELIKAERILPWYDDESPEQLFEFFMSHEDGGDIVLGRESGYKVADAYSELSKKVPGLIHLTANNDAIIWVKVIPED